jgi:hypothetical protein
MNGKRIITLLSFVFMLVLALSTPSTASDQKSFKGYITIVSDPDLTIDPYSYPYLAQVIGELGPPTWAQMQIYQGVVNVGGATIQELAQVFYVLPDRWDYYGELTMTVANGDQIFGIVEGSIYFDSDGNVVDTTGESIFTGGTGRFEGAEGSSIATLDPKKHDELGWFIDGWITTVGKAKEK